MFLQFSFSVAKVYAIQLYIVDFDTYICHSHFSHQATFFGAHCSALIRENTLLRTYGQWSGRHGFYVCGAETVTR